MRKITKSVFEENQRLQDERDLESERQAKIRENELLRANIEKLQELKEELGLTDIIFKLKTSEFDCRGFANLVHIEYRAVYDKYHYITKYAWSEEYYAREIDYVNKITKQYNVFNYFIDKQEYLYLLVDELEPAAQLSLNISGGYQGTIYINYYHPDMIQSRTKQKDHWFTRLFNTKENK